MMNSIHGFFQGIVHVSQVLRIFEDGGISEIFFLETSLRRKLRRKDDETKGSKCKFYLHYLRRITGDCDFIIHRG